VNSNQQDDGVAGRRRQTAANRPPHLMARMAVYGATTAI